jgi:tetratricopeptide (TPR) repeat protein
MKRKQGMQLKMMTATKERLANIHLYESNIEQPDISHFSEPTKKLWKLLINTMRAKNFDNELTKLLYLSSVPNDIKTLMSQELRTIQFSDTINIYYYLIQYGIMRIDTYSRTQLEQLSKSLLAINRVDSTNLWISNLCGIFVLRLGYAYTAFSNEYEKAFSCYKTVVEICPNYTGINRSIAFTLEASGRYEDAIAEYDTAIARNPNCSVLFCNRGDAKQTLGQYLEALDDYNMAIQSDPTNVTAIYKKGLIYSSMNQSEQAIQCYTDILLINPEDQEALEARAMEYQSCGLLIPSLRDTRQLSYLNNNFNDSAKEELEFIHICNFDKLI